MFKFNKKKKNIFNYVDNILISKSILCIESII